MGWPGWPREQVLEQSRLWVSPWRPATAVPAVVGDFEMYVVDGTEATLVACHGEPRGGHDFVRGALDAAGRCGAASLQMTIGPGYPGTGAIIGELLERGAEVVATDDILAGDLPTTTSRIAPSPGVDVVEVSTFADVVDFERISAHGWGYPEPTTEQFHDAYARLTSGWFLARCGEQAAGSAGFALVGEVARLWGAAVVPATRRRGVYRTLVRHRLVAAHAKGATLALVHAAPTSSPILQRLGFATFGERHTFRLTL